MICIAYHRCWDLSGHNLLTGGHSHLLHERVLQSQMVTAVYQKLILEMLRRMEILAWWLFPVAPSL